jgi:hypothetical protein
MSSTTSKGNYYKRKTKLWFEKMGYFVVLTEYTTAIPIRGRTIWIKKDLLGSDGVSMSREKNQFIFWNSKGTEGDRKAVLDHKSAGKLEFAKFPFPDCVERWVVIWQARVKEPTIIKCD